MKKLLALIAALFLLAPLAALAQQPIPTDDPLLTALREELKRSQDKLQLEGQKKPYFIQYIVNDTDQYAYESSFGAPVSRGYDHSRYITVMVRVGDYAQDNDLGFGLGEYDLLPTDDDIVSLRRSLWLATDHAYKNALQMLTAKESLLKQVETTDDVASFSKEAPVQYFEPREGLPKDVATLERAVDGATGLYRTDPDIQTLLGSVRLTINNYYVVNTEGTIVRMAQPGHMIVIHAETQAPDGMRLRRTFSVEERAPQALPTTAALKQKTADMLATLKALRAAPAVTEEYRGPVLFSNDAAGTVLESLLTKNLLGNRPAPGRPGRVTGAYATSFHARILPDSVSVVDDPTLHDFHGVPLIGFFPYDDEGVKAKPVTMVENGVLKNYLVARRPIKDFANSNSHGRNLGANINPTASNVILSSSKAETAAALKQKLMDVCKDRGLDYGYYAVTLGGLENPRVLYRIYVKDGHEELVRGAAIDELDARSLRTDLLGVGDDPYVTNNPGNLPVSYIAPSLLFGELVVKASTETKEKLPQYPPPAL
jgi:hypothetical protein